MKRIYVVMVADLFHYGHVDFLRHARAFGSHLIVGLTSDENSRKRKREPILCWEERKKVIAACKYVDEVWLHKGPLCNAFMVENNLHLRVYAPINQQDEQRKLDRYRDNGLDQKYLKKIEYTQEISTTKILNRITQRELSALCL